ncbi:ABC transporter permease [Dethiothermospora halolimnae]|uniref:ABC transporter permease n=1 Tax=Dethiothermospora halolimnae TaxID=3114390 RepID=UPI003CCBE235
MKKVKALGLYELKLQFRNFQNMFFVIAFPILMYLIFSNLLKDSMSPETQISIVEYLLPAYIPVIILNTGILVFGMRLVTHKEHSYFIKYKLLGIKPIQIALSLFLAVLICQISGIIALVVFAVVSKGVTVPMDNIVQIILGLGLINLFQFTFAFFLGSFFKSSGTYQTVALIIFYVQMFLGGFTFPPEMFSPFLVKILEIFNPIIHGLYVMRGVWVENKTILAFPKESLILVGLSLVFIVLGNKFFKWDSV